MTRTAASTDDGPDPGFEPIGTVERVGSGERHRFCGREQLVQLLLGRNAGEILPASDDALRGPPT